MFHIFRCFVTEPVLLQNMLVDFVNYFSYTVQRTYYEISQVAHVNCVLLDFVLIYMIHTFRLAILPSIKIYSSSKFPTTDCST